MVQEAGSRDRLRVLVVDDDALVLRALTRSLARRFDVVPAGNLGAAIAVLARPEPLDAIVCDWNLGNASGLSLYRHVVAQRPALASRMLVVSGGTASPAESAIFSGRWLVKPVETTQLVAAVEHVGARPVVAA